MSRCFLDVGAHFGESIFKALDPRLDFDLIVAFEPSSKAVERLHKIRSRTLTIEQFGLGDSNRKLTLFGAGYLGGSVYQTKIGISQPEETETIEIKDAATILRPYLERFDECFLKLNCEGSEIAILKSLGSANLLGSFKSIYIDWDSRKVPHLVKEIPKILLILDKSDTKYINAHDFEKTGWHGVETWLLDFRVKKKRFSLLHYHLFTFLPMQARYSEIIKMNFPQFTIKLIRLKVFLKNI